MAEHITHAVRLEAVARLVVTIGIGAPERLLVDASALLKPDDHHRVRVWTLVPPVTPDGTWLTLGAGERATLGATLDGIAWCYLLDGDGAPSPVARRIAAELGAREGGTE